MNPPIPPIGPLTPVYRDQRKVDADHLKLLAVFHFVGAGLAVLGLLFLAGHFFVMHSIMTNPEVWHTQKNPPPAILFDVLKWVYALGAFWFLLSLGLNLISGLCLLARKGRMFSLVVAGFNCLHLPLGTVLGVFTMLVLLRDSVRETYDSP